MAARTPPPSANPHDTVARARELFDFTRILVSESDRGSALAGAAFVEDALESLLRSSFVASSPKVVDRLFLGAGPLGSFAAKADVALALGLLGPMFHRQITAIRRIRNDFAHLVSTTSFDIPSIASRCHELEAVYEPCESPRIRYEAAVLHLLATLYATAPQRLDDTLFSDDARGRTQSALQFVRQIADELTRHGTTHDSVARVKEEVLSLVATLANNRPARGNDT